jgi:hypothetical protein
VTTTGEGHGVDGRCHEVRAEVTPEGVVGRARRRCRLGYGSPPALGLRPGDGIGQDRPAALDHARVGALGGEVEVDHLSLAGAGNGGEFSEIVFGGDHERGPEVGDDLRGQKAGGLVRPRRADDQDVGLRLGAVEHDAVVRIAGGAD